MFEQLLAETFGVPVDDPKVIAVMEAIRPAIDPYVVIRLQIAADPCRDWRVIQRRYRVSRGFIYRVWSERIA